MKPLCIYHGHCDEGQCEWCKKEATDLRDARDYEEGMCGRIYRVCGGCIKRQEDERYLAEHDDGSDDFRKCPTCRQPVDRAREFLLRGRDRLSGVRRHR